VDEALISRGEVVGLLFNVSDVAESLKTLVNLLAGDDGDEEADEG
jgi:hypothetical protein